MKSKLAFFTIMILAAGALLSAAQAPQLPKKMPNLDPKLFSREVMNGDYIISVWKDGGWREAGRLPFSKHLKERELDLSSLVTGSDETRVRITAQGPGAAHIDAVTLGGQAPTGVGGGDGARILKKISAQDNDLINASDGSLDLTFAGTAGAKALRLAARLESARISKEPFKFPSSNVLRPVTLGSDYYRYIWNTRKPPSGRPGSEDRLKDVGQRAPFFQVYAKTGSGHPSGTTFGWVSNDADNLYVTVDFTPDNTFDGDKDYAKIYIPVAGKIKEFKVSVPETKWGTAHFTYTDKVAYEHKVYDFVIPRSEIGSPAADAVVPVLVETYGTAALYTANVAVAYDPDHNRYLIIAEDPEGDDIDIYGIFVDANGNPIDLGGGPYFPIAAEENTQCCPDVAYDREAGRFLVVWQDDSYDGEYWDIRGRLVGAGGELIGDSFEVAAAYNLDECRPAVANDTRNHRFLVAYEFYLDENGGPPLSFIFGQLVGTDGSLIPAADGATLKTRTSAQEDSRFPISYAEGFPLLEFSPDLAYGSEANAYLVAFEVYIFGFGTSAGPQKFLKANVPQARQTQPTQPAQPPIPVVSAIGGQFVGWDGALLYTKYDMNFMISFANWGETPSVANDNIHHRFMVVWTDGEFYEGGGGLEIAKKPANQRREPGTGKAYPGISLRPDARKHDGATPAKSRAQALAQTRGNSRPTLKSLAAKTAFPFIPGYYILWQSYVFGQVIDAAGNLVLTEPALVSDESVEDLEGFPVVRINPALAFDDYHQNFMLWYFSVLLEEDFSGLYPYDGWHEGRLLDPLGGLASDYLWAGYEWEEEEDFWMLPAPALAYNSFCHNFLMTYPCYCGAFHWELIGDPFCPTLPEVTTAAVSQITTTSAVSGGLVLSDGGAEVTVRGVCWNSTGSPTTSDPKTSNGAGLGSFVSQMTGLTPGTTYYVRAYATNAVGTVYGDEKTFMTYKYIVRFVAGTGGTVTGTLIQYLYEGGSCTPVEAKANVGSCFINWTGPAAFTSTSTNPLTVTNVRQDMTITANFGKFSLAAQKLTDKAWIVKNYYGKIVLTLDGLDPSVSLKYVLYRKISGGAFASIKEFTKADIKANAITYEDAFLKAETTYVYYFAAYNGEGQEVGRSEEISVK